MNALRILDPRIMSAEGFCTAVAILFVLFGMVYGS